MPVQQHILNWLYSVLTNEYRDVNRAYNDVAQTLSRYPSLAPRTDVHTFPNGTSALLLLLSGTIPVNFRGSTYRFPISVWIPHSYPQEPPLVYVTPTETMMIRPGQHVDPQGQVYHPYIVGWIEFWDKSTIQDFLAILSDVFAKEPPVISRQQPRSEMGQAVRSPPPVPPLPSEMSPRPASHGPPRPPPPPPKTNGITTAENHSAQTSPLNQEGPPLPPIPSSSRSRYDSAPPLPPQQPTVAAQNPIQHYDTGTRAHAHPNSIHMSNIGPSGQPGHNQHPAANNFHQMPPPRQDNPHNQNHLIGPWRPEQVQPEPKATPHYNTTTVQPPPSDLLDGPLTLDIPDKSSIAPPPIPPNPEKDALLIQLGQALAQMRKETRDRHDASIAGLHAQRNAMLSALTSLQSEEAQLTQLSNMLTSNTTILHDALHKVEGVIEGSSSHPAPDIDELLVAPTVVANQLYVLVAEERALGDAIFMLGRAVERGRIAPGVFAKMTRSLAREWYLKKALVRKIGMGMGLMMGG